MAQTEQQIQSIENQIKSLQTQLNQMKSELSARDRALKAAQEQAKAAQNQAATAAAASAAAVQAAQSQAAAAQAAKPGCRRSILRKGRAGCRISHAPRSAAAARRVPGRPSDRHAGRVRGGRRYLPLAQPGIEHRHQLQHHPAANNLPTTTSANSAKPPSRAASPCWRKASSTHAQKLTGYLETDFLSAGSSSNSNQSNSYTLRLRQFWGSYDNTDWGLHVMGGQAWSLATMYKTG